MRHDSNPSLVVALAAAALALSPLTASAQGGGKKGEEHGKPKAAQGADHDHPAKEGAAKGGPGKEAKEAKKDAPPALPQAPVVSKAVSDLSTSCPKTAELRAQLEALADKRKASAATIKAAQNEAKKQLQTASQAQKQAQVAVKKPGGDSAALLERARVAQEAAVAQTRTVEAETQVLYATETELGKLALATDEAAAACTAAEEQLRKAADEARKAAQEARKESFKARALARIPPPKALEAQRAAHTKQLEAMRKSNDETKGAIDALKAVAATAPAPATPATPAPK